MKVLLLNQAFYPDVVSTAQHLTDLALELKKHGHQVVVIASRRGYDDPKKRFQPRETWRGTNIIRIRSLSLGKGSKWRRALDFASFLLSCFVRLLFLPRFDVIVALTSPPLISFLGAFAARITRAKFVFWVMDLNPDEAIAAGWLSERSLVSRVLQSLLSYSIRHAALIIALDRFMQARLAAKGASPGQLVVIPPWSHDQTVKFDPDGRTDFRQKHGLTGKFVVAYSGNHSPCHPLDTLLDAASSLRVRDDIVFVFIGGGSEYAKICDRAAREPLPNVLCLPYQPREGLAASLSAADLHVVVMGEPFVGLIHPCKIYNVLTVNSPVLYIGPQESHVGDIARRIEAASVPDAAGIHVAAHGRSDEIVNVITALAAARDEHPARGATPIAAQYSSSVLLEKMIAEIGRVSPRPARTG